MWDDVKALNAAAVTLAALAAVALAAGALVWTVRQPLFAFRDVVVTEPLARANAAYVEAVLRSELHGTFFTLDFDAARASLREVPWVRRVALRRQWPSRLEVTLDEYTPLARWNDVALVDPDGAVFSAGFDGELPQLTGPDGRAPDVVARYREFRDVLAPLQKQWDQLPPRRQANMLQKAQRWVTLPPGRREKIRERIARWQQMTPEQRQDARANERKFRELPPAQRERLHNSFERFQQLPPAQRERLMRQWRELPPAQRRQWIRPQNHGGDASGHPPTHR